MTDTEIVVEHRRTATTSRFAEVQKSLENLYYSLLLSSDPYAVDAVCWNRWLKMGFGITVKEPPRGVRRQDRLVLHTNPSAAPRIPMTIRGGNPQAIADLVALLEAIESERTKAIELEEGARTKAVEASDSVQQRLVQRLARSLSDQDLNESDISEYFRMVHDSILALAEDNIASVRCSAGT